MTEEKKVDEKNEIAVVASATSGASFWGRVEQSIHDTAVSWGGHIWDALKAAYNVVKPLVAPTAEELAEVAGAAFLAQVPKLISGGEKLSQATAEVVSALRERGKTILPSTAATAVQAVYDKVMAELHASQ